MHTAYVTLSVNVDMAFVIISQLYLLISQQMPWVPGFSATTRDVWNGVVCHQKWLQLFLQIASGFAPWTRILCTIHVKLQKSFMKMNRIWKRENSDMLSPPSALAVWFGPKCTVSAGNVQTTYPMFCFHTSVYMYFRWPAIICDDPIEEGRAVISDFDGEALWYHVEFLGKEHSHSWVRASHVTVFNPTEEIDLEDEEKSAKRVKVLFCSSLDFLRSNSLWNFGSFREVIDLWPNQDAKQSTVRSEKRCVSILQIHFFFSPSPSCPPGTEVKQWMQRSRRLGSGQCCLWMTGWEDSISGQLVSFSHWVMN